MQNSYDLHQDSNLVKQNLFARTQHINSLTKEFEKIMLLPGKQRQKWVKENGAFLDQIFDNLTDNSVLAFDGAELDAQGMELSMEFVSNLRIVMTMLKTIMGESRRLES